MNNPYEILNVDPAADEATIKKSYRKLAAKHHPDKGGDEEMFKKINEAYSIIGDSSRRQEYENNQHFGGLDGMFADIFGSFFNASPRPRQRPQEQTDAQITFDLRVSLEQIKHGISKRATFHRNKKCQTCHGVGGRDRHACNPCRGSGTITSRAGNMISQTLCQVCQGEGMTFVEKCSTCLGRGHIQVKESIKFSIKPEI